MSEITKLCGETEASCRCVEPDGHGGAHVCDCKGSWEFADGVFHIRAYPHGVDTLEDSLALTFGGE